MHRASGFGTRQMVMYVVPLVVLSALGLIFGRSLVSSASASLAASPTGPADPAGTLGTAQPPMQAAPASVATSAASMPSLGTKKGVFRLFGPKRATKGSFVVFVLDGPKRVMKTDDSAPFSVRIDSTGLPDGKYTASLMWVRPGRPAVASTHSLVISNPKPSAGAAGEAGVTGDSGTGKGGSAADGNFATQVLSLTNAERARAGCKALRPESRLTKAAQAHSADMAAKNYFSHDSRNGDSPFDRMKSVGYDFSAAAENIAMGQATPAAVMDAWMNSPGHKANILNCTYTQLGVGYALGNGSAYWTQDFGKPL